MTNSYRSADLFRACAEIDVKAIKHNISEIKKRLPSGVGTVAVLKADAYGHGAVKLAYALEDSVSAFAVAIANEAIELYKSGIRKPIYILGFTHPSLFADILRYGIIPTVFSYEDAEKLSQTALSMNTRARINIKVDTGMGRIGFSPDSHSRDEILKIAALEGISLYGIFSHLSTSDEEDKGYTNAQEKIFSSFVSSIESSGVRFEKIHISNSAAAIDMPSTQPSADLERCEVRIGIALYGLYPSDAVSREVKLRSAMTFKSHVIHIKRVPAGTPIGYGRSFVTTRESVIGTVPVGYADGYQRRLSNRGKVIVGGKYAPIVGKICMDMFMIDLTDIGEVSLYDEVILMGSDKDCAVSADQIAAITKTISYDVVCSIGKRVPRVYKE